MQRIDFGVGSAESAMVSFADDFTPANQDASHHRIGLDVPRAPACERECSGHETLIGLRRRVLRSAYRHFLRLFKSV